MAEWNTIKNALKQRSSGDLVGLVKDLYGLSDNNRNFLHTRCNPNTTALNVKKYKTLISTAICPNFCNDRNAKIDLAKARKVIADFSKATENAHAQLELMVHFVEVGTQQTQDIGIEYEAYFNSMESMFERIVKQLSTKNKALTTEFLPRLRAIVANADNAGYGYQDTLTEMFTEAFGEIR